eukprot:TCONS_00016667-protein
MNTPKLGLRVCQDHEDTTARFSDHYQKQKQNNAAIADDKDEVDEESLNEDNETATTDEDGLNDNDSDPAQITTKKEKNGIYQGVIRICNTKETRTSTLYEVLWHTGQKTWVRDEKLPQHLRNANNKIVVQDVTSLGQPRQILGFTRNDNGDSVDLPVPEKKEETPDPSSLKCGTDKSKHIAKNKKTAGVLVMAKPCGIVVNIKELFNCESISQVYGHLHDLLSQDEYQSINCIVYDDACHLLKYSKNPVRKDDTNTSKRIATLEMKIDRFHYRNHVDPWCRRVCNPKTSDHLAGVNTETCEQLFSWFSKYAPMTKHMNRQRFIFLTLYLLHFHNKKKLSMKY